MNMDLLLALTILLLGIERFAALPGWILGILAVLTGLLMLFT
jgi:hypothetical protein